MDAKNHDGRANIKPIKIEKATDKYSRDNVQTSTWRPAKRIIREQKTWSSQENISDIIFGCGVHCCIFLLFLASFDI